MSTSWQASDPSPALVVHPPAVASLDEAHAAIEQWEHYSRKRLDSAQRLAVELMMAETSDGMWAARTTGRCEPRQNGKGDEVEVVEAWGLTQRAEAIVHTAHEIPTAKSAHLRLVAHLEGHRDLRRLMSKTRYANGDQAIEFHNGGIIVYRTRTSGGGRGLDDISRLVVDEAQHAQPEQLASATPILAVAPNPQTNFTGSAGIAGRSDWWWSFRKRALEGAAGSFAWLEHSAEQVSLGDNGIVQSVPPDPTDRAAWRRGNPGYPSRIPDDYLLEQLRLLGPELFAREHLSVWDPEHGSAESVFGAGFWEAGAAPRPDGLGAGALAVAVSIDLTHASIGAAATHGDDVHVKPLQHGPGTVWVVDRAVELQAEHNREFVIDGRGPAAVLIPALERAEVNLRIADTGDVLDACAGLFELVREGRAKHMAYPELDAAVAGAVKRPVGDRWAWGRKQSSSDISPLEAVTLAAWAIQDQSGRSVYEERGMVTL